MSTSDHASESDHTAQQADPEAAPAATPDAAAPDEAGPGQSADGVGAPEQAQAEQTQGGQTQAEAEQAKPEHAEQAKPEQTEHAESDRAKPEAAKPEQAKQAQPEQTEHAESDRAKPEQAQPEQAKQEQPEQAEPEQAQQTQAKQEQAEAEQARPEAAKPEQAQPEQADPEAAPTPTPTPKPTPAAPKPGPVPSPAALAKRPKPAAPATPDAPAVVPPVFPSTPGASDWGRVDENGVVSVKEGDDWRVVGEYPDGTHEEALQYYVRKYDELAFKVQAIEQRHQAGGAAASELRKQATQLKGDVVGAAAVGDLAALDTRLTSMIDELAEASAQEAAAHRAAVDQAIADRTAIVETVEKLAAREPQTIQWKQATAELNDLFAAWQNHQKTGPRLPKSTAQALWKRFRDARSTVERARRAFFAELDEVHKAAKAEKTRIIERAEALTAKGEDGIPQYRDLLEEWKRAGRAGRKADDALWARFKAAGDVLYGARADRNAEEQAESKPRIEAREALLEEAKKVADISDLKQARKVLTDIQRKWDEVGRIFPRDAERDLDGRMRKIETALKDREDVDWKRNNPETKARANDMGAQLRESIEGYEKELEAAKTSGDKKAEREAQEALDARLAWLRAIGG